jgi:hypothetical protein
MDSFYVLSLNKRNFFDFFLIMIYNIHAGYPLYPVMVNSHEVRPIGWTSTLKQQFIYIIQYSKLFYLVLIIIHDKINYNSHGYRYKILHTIRVTIR